MLQTSLFRSALILFGVVLTAGALLCQAQSKATATIRFQGRVLDQNRAALPGAKITVTIKGRSAAVSTVSDENGEFSLALEPNNGYTVRVTANGFSEFTQTVNVPPSDSNSLEIILQVAGANAVVNVGDESSYKVETVASATKTLTPLRDVPQAISVVTKEQIKDQMLLSVADAVRYMPGVTAHQGENNRDQVIIRGQNTSADFFLNGVRDDVQYYRDFYNLERLETLKGPNAMIFGRGGGGGVINRVTKEAVFAPLREITVQGGSFADRRFAADFNQPLTDEFAFRVNSFYEKSDSFRRFVGLERYGVNPTLTFNPGKQTRITFGYEFFRDQRVADRGITSFQGRPANVPISAFYGNPDDSRVRANVNVLSGTVERQFGKLNIRNRTLYGDYDRFYQNFVPGAANAAGTLVSLVAYNNATNRKNFFNQTDLTYAVSTGSIRHTFLGGAEFGNQRTTNFRQTGFFNNTATSVNAPFDNPTITAPVTFRQSGTDADNRLRLNLAATYLQDQIEINRYVQIVAGLRYDYFDLRYHNNRNNDTLRRIDNLVSPRLGIVVKPIERLSIYGNYSVSYLPSSGDQFASLTSVTEQVKPEKFQNYEVGAKWDIRRNLAFTSALYRLDRTNTRAIDPNNPTAIIQTGSQRTNGFEAGLTGNVTPRWSVSGGYAYQDAFITSATAAALAGKQVGQVPHNTFSLWNKYQFTSRFGAGLGIVNRSDMFAAVDNTVVLPGYTKADAAFFYSFNERWRLQANVENLFNKKYYLNADSNTNITPGSPRAVRLGLIARF
jgi:catecholate siderophore receptor